MLGALGLFSGLLLFIEAFHTAAGRRRRPLV